METQTVGGEATNKIITVLGIALISTLIGVAIASVVLPHFSHPNTGTISNPSIQEYLDSVAITPTSTIDWGTVTPGISYFMDYGINNTGNIALNITVITNLPSPWMLAWSLNNTVWNPAQLKTAQLILTVPASATVWPAWGFSVNATEV